ncbi:WD-repeat protein-like protein [Pseudovirgaria hyperparasitica]|uniref:WD-repeat protein-like protein n=1 Tax=Pseudovirgaria hyperparasitica TaxID=470096 RepID=A0A6A6WH64_9PEZI|nr:WD-repeat protein-like protein [Pseudovirgaria hyperparasitica]KAF2761410.1 WD-repeat protein-like protein [Pseudovirgaria hyperparasitica]
MPATVQNGASLDGPIVKRTKTDAESKKPRAKKAVAHSRIFTPFRTVGLVSPTDVPFTTAALGKTTFNITTSVGRSLQTYDLKRGLSLIFLTRPQTPGLITATTSWKHSQTLAAWGGDGPDAARGVWLYKRGKAHDELEKPPEFDENVKQLLVYGSWIVACCESKIIVWQASNFEYYTTLMSGSRNTLSGGICSMPTYLNKIFAGRSDGSVEIWNLKTGRLVYTILPQSADYGAVVALEPSPALSLLAISYAGGPLNIHDIRLDKVVIALKTGSGGKFPVTSITFRTDGLGAGSDGTKSGVMATACKGTGDVTFWDLNKGGRKMSVLRGAHNPPSVESGASGGISKVEFLHGQAVLVTSGMDNALKTWIFNEMPFSPVPQILHSRSGHAAPLSSLQFLPSDFDGSEGGGKWLLSASRDRSLWGWSLRKDGQSTELSQGQIEKKAKKTGALTDGLGSIDSRVTLEDLKAPKITCIACSLNRDGGIGAVPSAKGIWTTADKYKGPKDTAESSITGWESVVTGHEGDKMARTWFWGRKRAGRWKFPTGDGSPVSTVGISPCGTFALVGSTTGSISMYNLQSGMRRQRFPPPLTPKQAQRLKTELEEEEEIIAEPYSAPKKFHRGQGKHTNAVTGLVVDSLNRTVVSCGADGKVKFWDFATGVLKHQLDWYPTTTIKSMRYHRQSDLIALACSDGAVRVVDIETKKLIRELWSSDSQVVDLDFSNDGQWIVAATSDRLVRVWDLPTGHLIDAMKLRSACTALAFSNTGEFLATAQEDSVGVSIWTNRSLFAHVPKRHISDEEIAETAMPTASGEGGQNVLEGAFVSDSGDDDDEEEDLQTSAPSLDQLSESLTTLSLVPKSRWQNLLHLDTIRARNKPIEAPKKPVKAPFFLPSLNQGPEGTANANTTTQTSGDGALASTAGPISRVTKASLMSSAPDAFSKLIAEFSHAQQDPVPLFTHLSALPPPAADIALRSLTPMELPVLISALTVRLRQRRDYELVQAWMAVLLRVHGETIVGDEGTIEKLREWRVVQEEEKTRLGRLVGYCGGVIGYLRSAR